MNPIRQYKGKAYRLGLLLVSGILLATASGVAKAEVPISQTPLFLTSPVEPNVVLLLGDSFDMMPEVAPVTKGLFNVFNFTEQMLSVLPGAANANYNNQRVSVRYDAENALERLAARSLRSVAVNELYYDPSITYRPWPHGDGTYYPNADPTAAPNDPARSVSGTLNLTVEQAQMAHWYTYNALYAGTCLAIGSNDCNGLTAPTVAMTFFPALYFRYTGGDLRNADNFVQIKIVPETPAYSGDGRIKRSECTAGSCTYAQEIQNFANWYSYYRNRYFSTYAAVGHAFDRQSSNLRVGFGTVNKRTHFGVDDPPGNSGPYNYMRGGLGLDAMELGVRRFVGADRTTWFKQLYEGFRRSDVTELRRGLYGVGEYFSRTDNKGPWGGTPGSNDTTAHLACRRSNTILVSNGQWSDTDWDYGLERRAHRFNIDGTAGPTITGPGGQSYTYQPVSPFADEWQDTLADVAMHYWKRDLRPDLLNKISATKTNPAFWQHMVTYTVGYGVLGSVDAPGAFAAIDADPPVSVSWRNPTVGALLLTDYSQAGIMAWFAERARAASEGWGDFSSRSDDFLHTAVNGRGRYYDARDPESFSDILNKVLADIVAQAEASSTAAATSASVLQTDTLLYTASFRSTDWSGTLVAREVNPGNGEAGAVKWDAEQIMNAALPANRKIFTAKANGTPVALDYALLSATQQDALSVNPSGAAPTAAAGADRVAWLRGTDHTGLRSRLAAGVTRRIGDLVGSDPQFMSKRDFGNTLLGGTEGTAYRTFRNTAAYKARPNVLFVGSNGGMLHAFHAGTPYKDDPDTAAVEDVMDPDGGKELFAYVPSELLLPVSTGAAAPINQLMRPDYTRRTYVDGSPSEVTDAYLGGAWKSVLVGSMGTGGRTVFALDVTDPAAFNASKVLWEFGYANNACVADATVGSPTGSTACREIGYGVTKPKIVRMRDGSWAALFGNGYNSASHTAKLFVVDLQTGRLKYLLDTGVGGTGVGLAEKSNGLAAVEATDWPATDLKLSTVYAGDLLGNMWRFNLATGTPTFSRLFSATDATAVAQPITGRPSLAMNPNDPAKIVVLFGTGSFFREGDNSLTSPQKQTMYGVYDAVTPVVDTVRANLLAQTISSNAAVVTLGAKTYPIGSLRFISDNAMDASKKGWRIDLPAAGERIISEPTFPSGSVQTRVRFSSMIPDDDPCGSGRSGFAMDFNLLSGARAPSTVFDLTGDGVFDGSDNVGAVVVSGIRGTTGERMTVIRKADRALDFLYGAGGKKVVDGANAAGPVGRQSWRQLR